MKTSETGKGEEDLNQPAMWIQHLFRPKVLTEEPRMTEEYESASNTNPMWERAGSLPQFDLGVFRI
jgi:hypothetical protein